MKEYILQTMKDHKVTAYNIFKNNENLMDILNQKYPKISDIKITIQLYLRDMNDIPECKYSGCNNKVSYKNGEFQKCCSRKCSASYSKENDLYALRVKKAKSTNIKKYGNEHYSQTDEFKEKYKNRMLEVYGTEHYSQTDEFKEKYKNRMLEVYGTEHYSQTDEFKEKTKQTNMEKYGVSSYLSTDELKERTKKINLERYGVEHHSQTEDFKKQTKKTNMEKYGVENPAQNPDFIEKMKQTNVNKYGVEYYSQTDEFKDKFAKTSMDRYGVENPAMFDEFKEKAKLTNIEKFGAEYYSQTNEFKERFKKTNVERYGAEHPLKSHYDDDYKNVFDDIEKFVELLYEHGTYKLAELINCNVSTIHRLASQHNVQLPPRPKSYQEEIITDFLIKHNIHFISNAKKILLSGKELDFYFPDNNIAIEFNGLYWHSEINGGKDKSYHYNKWKECNDLGITLLSIYEDEFDKNRNFWFNKILYITGNMKPTKIHARKCEVRELNNVTYFLNEHHFQGSCASSYKFGLFYNDELVSTMTFSKTRDNKTGVIELSRFCNHSGYLVSGGASKLLTYFIKNYGDFYNSIISFSDNNYSNGNVYKALGFLLYSNIAPDYKYVVNRKQHHKANFRKSSIFKKFDIPENMKNKSEWELMQYLGYDRIWDTGKKKWELKIST